MKKYLFALIAAVAFCATAFSADVPATTSTPLAGTGAKHGTVAPTWGEFDALADAASVLKTENDTLTKQLHTVQAEATQLQKVVQVLNSQRDTLAKQLLDQQLSLTLQAQPAVPVNPPAPPTPSK